LFGLEWNSLQNQFRRILKITIVFSFTGANKRVLTKIKWDLAIINALSNADSFLGRLAGECGKLPNPHILIRPFIAREAVLSSRIEGTQATLGDVLK